MNIKKTIRKRRLSLDRKPKTTPKKAQDVVVLGYTTKEDVEKTKTKRKSKNNIINTEPDGKVQDRKDWSNPEQSAEEQQ